MRALLALVVLASLPACQIIFNEADDDDDCKEDPVADRLRNPDDGTCQDFGGGGGCGDPRPLAGDREGAPLAYPDWAVCDGYCETLTPDNCLFTDGCRIAEIWEGDGSLRSECWGVAPSGPVHGGCDGLDAHECSRHDDCVASYVGTREGLAFEYCRPEALCDAPVMDGDHRDPYSGECVNLGGGGCGDGAPEWQPQDWALCETCAGLDETTCLGADGCRAIYLDNGLDNLLPVYGGCWGTAPQGGPVQGGDCTQILDAYECSRHDDCTATYAIPEIGGGFEYCGNEGPIVEPAPACREIADEATCVDMADGCLASGQCNEACAPIYEGSGCSCDPSGCGCETWTYQSCVPAGGGGGEGFMCGDLMCTDKQYCEVFSGGISAEVFYSCIDIPEICFVIDESTCGCLGYENQSGWCTTDADGHTTVTINAP
jgi:hypothetical protein